MVRKLGDLNGDGDYEQKQNLAYDGNQVVMDFRRTGSGLVQTGDLEWRYLWGPAVDQILAEENVDNGADETVQWTLTDHLNTVRDIAKYDLGSDMTTVVNHLVYDAFGKVTSESNPAIDSLFLFTGRPFDSDTQLQNDLNRWYDASVGRWLSEDPIGFDAGDVNLCGYVENRPTDTRDPTGEAAPAWDPTIWYHLTPDRPWLDRGFWGDFAVRVNWLVKPAPVRPPRSAGVPETSWIIQHVTAYFDVRDARTGRRIPHPADDGRWDYWEAWEVPPGKASPATRPGRPVDDSFSIWGGIPDTCGTIIISGTAQFYPNADLPADFIARNPNTHAGDLRSTTNRNALAGLQPRSFPPVARTVIATWTTQHRGRTQLLYLVSREAPEPWPGVIV